MTVGGVKAESNGSVPKGVTFYQEEEEWRHVVIYYRESSISCKTNKKFGVSKYTRQDVMGRYDPDKNLRRHDTKDICGFIPDGYYMFWIFMLNYYSL